MTHSRTHSKRPFSHAAAMIERINDLQYHTDTQLSAALGYTSGVVTGWRKVDSVPQPGFVALCHYHTILMHRQTIRKMKDELKKLRAESGQPLNAYVASIVDETSISIDDLMKALKIVKAIQ